MSTKKVRKGLEVGLGVKLDNQADVLLYERPKGQCRNLTIK